MLHIHSISVNYGEAKILKDVSLDVAPGEVVALIGPNGAGKTTLIRAISGVLPLQTGLVQTAGYDLSTVSVSQRARLIAVVPQARNLPPAYTVNQAVLMGRTPYLGWIGNPSQVDFDKTDWALESTKISHLADRRVEELSGGEQQLVLVARALAQDAKVILLDEPTAHLDLRHQSTILELVRKLSRDRGLAVLMSLHDLNLVSLFSDKVALLGEGQLRAFGTPKEVFNQNYLSDVYHVQLHIISHPVYDIPLVLLDGNET